VSYLSRSLAWQDIYFDLESQHFEVQEPSFGGGEEAEETKSEGC
jgi:hypothetical protein